MNHRLAEFASNQVEAITNVLDMVARDRRRVQVLLKEVESPSLRQYLQEWLHATKQGPEEEDEDDLGSRSSGNEAENATARRKRDTDGCPCGCWNTQNQQQQQQQQRSFWKMLQERPQCVKAHYARAIQRYQQRQGRLAFGVSYEWLTEPMSYGSRRFDWEDLDHFFEGQNISFIESLEGNPESTRVFIQQANIVSDSSWYRIVQIPDNYETNTYLFGGTRTGLPSVQDVLSTTNQSIVYDIVFYAGEYNCFLRHQRTAKGTVTFSAIKSTRNSTDVNNHQGDNDNDTDSESDSDNPHDIADDDDENIQTWILQGTVQMDPCMQSLDVIPWSGDFTFQEHTRFERIISEQAEADEWEHASTSVLSVRVTQLPEGMSRNVGNTTTTPTTTTNSSRFHGEVRVLKDRTAARLLSGKEATAQNSDPTIDPDSVMSLTRADTKLKTYHSKMCLWMHRHTHLPKDVIQRIGEYVSPPPVLFLEPGDLVIDMDWTYCLTSSENNIDNIDYDGDVHDDSSSVATSCLIARRRRP